MPQLRHQLNRLRGMTPREVSHRVRERLYTAVDRVRAGHSVSAGPGFRSYLAGAPLRRFYRSIREDLRPLLQRNFPQWIDRAVMEAEQLCRHEVSLLGYPPVALGPEIDWHRDPVTGRTWEQRYWADYRLVEDNGGRDPKVIHELNRHQHLPRLAKAFVLTGDERYAAEAVAQLNSWIDQNPTGQGINWQSSLEIGIRAISWLWTIFPLLPSHSLDDASAQRIGDSLFAQLDHVHRYPSVFSSPNTHLIGEAAALYIAGLLFQDRKRPAVWLDWAQDTLAAEAERQILADGVYGELSSCYHCYALDFYLQAMILAKQNAAPLPAPVPQKVESMLHFLMHLTRPDGTLPPLGDDDGGRALALDQRNYRSYRDGLCIGSILFQDGDFKHQAGGFSEEAIWLLGENAWDQYCQLESREPAETHASFSHAGYSVRRSGWGPLDSHVVFDCGGLGMLTGGHAHADGLSITTFAGGREVLVDPGTFVYNCAPEWREYFRSTRAHNTVTVDGHDQAAQAGTFRWGTRFHGRTGTQVLSGSLDYIEAEHDGYNQAPNGVIHRRRLLNIHSDYWIVVDDFRGSGDHRFDFHFHFAGDSAERLALFASQPVQTESIAGWMSRGYGQKQPCTSWRAAIDGRVPLAAMTFLPQAAPWATRQLSLTAGNGIACACRHDGVEDIAVLSHDDLEIVVEDFHFRGEFVWLRLERGEPKQILAVRARSLTRGDKTIFRRSQPETWGGAIDTTLDEKTLCAEFAGS